MYKAEKINIQIYICIVYRHASMRTWTCPRDYWVLINGCAARQAWLVWGFIACKTHKGVKFRYYDFQVTYIWLFPATLIYTNQSLWVWNWYRYNDNCPSGATERREFAPGMRQRTMATWERCANVGEKYASANVRNNLLLLDGFVDMALSVANP